MTFAKQIEILKSNKGIDLVIADEKISPNNDLKYRYLGEIDDPCEMLYDFATISDIERCGRKANWFLRSDGLFLFCDDSMTDSILESNKCVAYIFDLEQQRDELYEELSKDEKISYRINLQDISEDKAKEIVCSELGIPAYKYTFLFDVRTSIYNSLNWEITFKNSQTEVNADSIEDAITKAEKDNYKVGDIIRKGKIYSDEDRAKMKSSGRFFNPSYGKSFTETVTNIVFNLKKQSDCYDF